MTALQSEPVVEPPVRRRAERLVVVVGVDGSESSYRALDAAALLISGRTGSLEVVYVAHSPAGADMAAEAQVEAQRSLDQIELELKQAVRSRLEGVEQRWHFQRLDGAVAHELLAAAERASGDYGGGASVVLVVGSAMHSYHHVVGSVPVALVRHAKYPVVVVP
jgi:nucleotide-binding universal stress UspA family protein